MLIFMKKLFKILKIRYDKKQKKRGYHMMFEKMIVHILDCEHNTYIPSTSCMPDVDGEVEKMLNNKADKVLRSAKRKSGSFKEQSVVKKWLLEFKKQELTFEQCSQYIAQHIFDLKMKYALYQSSDLMLGMFVEEGRRYMLIVENAYTHGITHELLQEHDEIITNMITYRTLLSSNLVKNDRAFLVELSDMSMHCVENKVEIEADNVNFFADIVFEGTTKPSYKESVHAITKLTEEMSEKYDLDEVSLMPQVKSIINDHVEEGKAIVVDDIADIVFASTPLAKDDFKQEVKKIGVPSEVSVDYVKPAKSEKVQKIRTDRGIEITIPVDYMNAKEFVEFKTQSDGTISIQLKNITHITSK